MARLNQVQLIGRLTGAPNQSINSNNNQLTEFSLAVDDSYSGNSRTMFVDCVAWGKTADVVSRFCKKGQEIYVGGKLKLDIWQDKATGKNRRKHSITVSDVQLLGGKRDSVSSDVQQGFKNETVSTGSEIEETVWPEDVPF